MKLILPPPLAEAPPPRSAWQDLRLLLAVHLRVSLNKIRHWPLVSKIIMAFFGVGLLAMIIYLGTLAFGALETMDPAVARGFLSLLFMAGMFGVIFFGITAAFATLYLSEDLELLFMAPIPSRVVFAMKSLLVAVDNMIAIAIFVLLPGLFFGLLFGADPLYYLWMLLAGLGLLTVGTALAELLNLLIMRIVPPHRSREAVGVLGGVAGIMIAIFFQLPNLIMSQGDRLDIGGWLATQQRLLQVMDYFPWGWGSRALAGGAAGNHLAASGWCLLILALGAILFAASFFLVERSFRQGWISLSEGGGGRRKRRRSRESAGRSLHHHEQTGLFTDYSHVYSTGSAWRGMWSVAKKDLLYLKRDAREWFGYLIPLIIMLFFIGQYLFMPADAAQSSLIAVLIMYTIMFSGNMSLSAFGREGEADWLLNSVPLAGWPVVWGKLVAAVLPTLLLMELLLAGTGLLIGLQPKLIIGLAVGAVFISLGASAIGLHYSIRYCRYNPEAPQQRIKPGPAMFMYLVNLVFIFLIAFGLLYIFPPAQLIAMLADLPPVPFAWGFPETLLFVVSRLAKPLLWPAPWRVLFGLLLTGGIWAAVFFSFMAATVQQSRKGLRGEIVTGVKKKPKPLTLR